VCTSDLPSSRLLRDGADTLLACIMLSTCRALGDAIGDEVVDEARECGVRKATLEVIDLRVQVTFVAECARNTSRVPSWGLPLSITMSGMSMKVRFLCTPCPESSSSLRANMYFFGLSYIVDLL
jgi:hypothetical protein